MDYPKNTIKHSKILSNSKESLTDVLSRQAPKVMFCLIILFVASPYFYFIRSIFLPYHEGFYTNSNQRTLGIFWYDLLKQTGFWGLIFAFLSKVGSTEKTIRERGWFVKTVRRHPVPLFLSLLLVWSFFSYLFSDNPNISLHGSSYRHEGFLAYLAYAGLFCCAYFTKQKKNRLKIMRFFTITAALISLLVLFSNDTMKRLFSLKTNAALFQNINHCGYYLCLASMMAAALFLIEKSKKLSFLLWLPVYALISSALLKNGSFGPFVAVVGGLIFLLTLTFIYVKEIRIPAVILVVVFIAVSIGFNLKSGYIKKEGVKLTQDIVNIVENNEEAPKAGSNRWILWQRGVQYALEKPLFGYGPDNLHARYKQDGLNHDRPHNELLQLAANLGFPAAFFYITALIFFFLNLLKHRKTLTVEALGLHTAVFTYLLSSMVGLSMFYTTPYYFIFLGLTCRVFHSVVEESESIDTSEPLTS